MLFVGQAPEGHQKVLLTLAEAGRTGHFHDLPGMAIQGCGEPQQPICGQLSLAEFKLVELLIGRANQRCERPQREATSLSQFLKPISQKRLFGVLRRS